MGKIIPPGFGEIYRWVNQDKVWMFIGRDFTINVNGNVLVLVLIFFFDFLCRLPNHVRFGFHDADLPLCEQFIQRVNGFFFGLFVVDIEFYGAFFMS